MKPKSILNPAAKDSKKGFILMTSYMLLSVLSVSSLALFSRAGSFRLATERNINKVVAFNMAESALDIALNEIEADPNYAGTAGYVALGTGAVQPGGYQITVVTPEENPNVREIIAVGHAPSNNPAQKGYETRTVTAYAQIQTGGFFDFAVFAEESVQMSGNARLDSYDSRNGPYGGSNVSNNGDLGTDSTGAGTVSLSGNVEINGDAVVGPSGDPDDVITMTGNSEITGEQSAASAPLDYEVQTSNATSLGALSISGNTRLQLAGGTYRYSSLSISGNGQLQALGPVVIYVDGSVKISGNGVSTQSNSPPNFVIYQTTGDSVQISGNGNFYGGIYAPASQVKNTGNGEIFGAIVSETYHQSGNGKVHYDEAMNEIGGDGTEGVGLLSWREENTTAWNG